MAATLTQDRFTGPEWLFERKFDGIRLLAYKNGTKVELFSRNRLPQNIPALAQAIAKLPHHELVLDGEIDWHAVMGTHASSRAAYHIFDILWLDGRDVCELPLEERQALLKKLPLKPPLDRVTAVKDSADEKPWELAQRKGWEGVIAKRRGSIYEPRRSSNWLKMKVELSQEFVVGGFTDPQGKRVGLGALLVGYYDYASQSVPPAPAGGSRWERGRPRPHRGSSPTLREGVAPPDFIFAGKVGTGFNTELLMSLRTKLDRIEIAKPPFTRAVGLPRLRAHWVQPEIVVQVGFIQWTGHGKLRHPRLLGVRMDKDAREVVRE